MSLTKRHYTAHETYITAQNLNDIQDEIVSQEADIAALAGQWTRKNIASVDSYVSFGLTAGKIYLLVIAKQNTGTQGYQGLYIVSAYGSSGNGTTITPVLASTAATIATESGNPLALKVTSAVTNVVAVMIQLN